MIRKYLSFLTLALLFLMFNHKETEASNQKVNLTLPNGATYYGEVKNNKPHGKGTMNWGPSKVYSGDWYNGQRSGTGKYISDRLPKDMKIVYEGEWRNDRPHGTGIRRESNPELAFQRISKGLFKDHDLISGHAITQSIDSIWFEYLNGSTLLQFSVSDREQADKLIHSKLARGRIQVLNYYKREKSTPDYKGFEYARGMEDYGSSLSEGVYRTGDYEVMELHTGVSQRFEDEEHYRIENYKNGRLVSARDMRENGRFAGIVQGKINNNKHVLQPYLGEFSKLLKAIGNDPEPISCSNSSTSVCEAFPIKFE
ncbi:hypothetical protein [Paenibacillus lautus]|uniref:hypothetical protein n=1 Tax=Paenibacillus lautus TaxID=1401 RepID=UPI00345FF13B